jgi:hypothetical protein
MSDMHPTAAAPPDNPLRKLQSGLLLSMAAVS